MRTSDGLVQKNIGENIEYWLKAKKPDTKILASISWSRPHSVPIEQQHLHRILSKFFWKVRNGGGENQHRNSIIYY